MTVERIESADDPRVTRYRSVRDRELMRASRLFVAEGRAIVRRVLEDGRYRVDSVLVNDAALHALDDVLASAPPDAPVFVAGRDQLAAIAGYDVHRGCLALVHRPKEITTDHLIASSPALVVLDSVSDADNVGGVFRSAAALGGGGVMLSPSCCDPFYRKAIRTSMGAVLGVPFARAALDDWPGVLTRVRDAGFTLVALTPRQPSETLDAFAARSRALRIALIVGAEGAGLSASVEAAADVRVRIPLSDRVDSLNLAVAAGIALNALAARRL